MKDYEIRFKSESDKPGILRIEQAWTDIEKLFIELRPEKDVGKDSNTALLTVKQARKLHQVVGKWLRERKELK